MNDATTSPARSHLRTFIRRTLITVGVLVLLAVAAAVTTAMILVGAISG